FSKAKTILPMSTGSLVHFSSPDLKRPSAMPSVIKEIPSDELVSNSARETFDIGVRIGSQLSGGEIILLNGRLGAGKTMLVKGIAHALAIDEEEVTSPSFTLVNPHRGPLLLYHIDLSRLD